MKRFLVFTTIFAMIGFLGCATFPGVAEAPEVKIYKFSEGLSIQVPEYFPSFEVFSANFQGIMPVGDFLGAAFAQVENSYFAIIIHATAPVFLGTYAVTFKGDDTVFEAFTIYPGLDGQNPKACTMDEQVKWMEEHDKYIAPETEI